MNRNIYILSTILLFWVNALFAQNVTFTASVSKNPVAVGEQFEVTFEMNGTGDRFAPPAFGGGLQVLSGPNVSTSMTSINGNTTVSNSYSYILAATQEGNVTIGAASIYSNGKLLATRPISLKVTKGQPVPQGRRGRPGQQQAQANSQVQEASAAEVANALFIRAAVDKTNVYIGQQLNVNYRIYTRVDILQNQLDKIPDLNGFWSQDVNPHMQNVQWHTEIYNGNKYNVADIKQSILFPERAGNLTIDPMGMTFIIREQAPAHDVMEEFFGGSFKEVKVKLKSPAVTIHVKPLPEAGKPLDYGGAVGTFSMEAGVDKTALRANETINYNVKISGTGNIKLMKNLSPVFPADFEKYDPKVTDTVNAETGKLTGSRLYNYLLIPRHEGKDTIHPIRFTYFNPATARYVTLTSKTFPINVAKGIAEKNVSTLSSADKQDIKLMDKDIRYIKTKDRSLSKDGEDFFGSTAYNLLLLAGPLLFIGAMFYRTWYRKANSDIVKVRSRKAGKIAAKALAQAKTALAANNSAAFYETLFKGIYGYLSNKFNIPYANLDQETISSVLRAKGVGEPLITQMQDTLELCDMARFAPVSGISEKEVFERSKNMIHDIEDEI